jgi:hypothetical protein
VRATTLIKIEGADKYRRLSLRLKAAGRGDLQRKLNRAIRRQGGPALTAVRAAWLTVDVQSEKGGRVRPDRSTGLRRRTAAATRISVLQRGVSIQVKGSRIDPGYGRSLAWYLNGSPGRRPWRHPVFGRRENPNDWQQQRGQEVFFSTLRRHERDFRAAVDRAMETTAKEIEGV